MGKHRISIEVRHGGTRRIAGIEVAVRAAGDVVPAVERLVRELGQLPPGRRRPSRRRAGRTHDAASAR